jgi:alkaline phosphatase D
MAGQRCERIGAPLIVVRWELAEDAGFRLMVQSGAAEARAKAGHSVHVEVTGLKPGRHYWYRFTAQGQRSAIGRSRTAPAAGGTQPVRFVNAGCQMYEHGHFTAWRHIAAEELDFVFHYGDYIYEYAEVPPGERRWGREVRRHVGGQKLGRAAGVKLSRTLRLQASKRRSQMRLAHGLACAVKVSIT